MVALVVSVVAALVASVVVTGLFRAWALRHQVLDVPNERSSHVVPTPRGGGVGIVAGVAVGLAVWLAFGGVFSVRAAGWIVGALLVAGVSFADDLRGLPVLPRLGTHLVASVLVTLAGVQDVGGLFALYLVLAFLWIVLLTNLYNFMDGIDGLAAVQAVIGGAAFALAGALFGNALLLSAGAVLSAASLGFLVYNLPPARLFMGDVSSTFLGFSFASLMLLGNLGVGGSRVPLYVGALILAPFLFDGVVTLLRRVARREAWWRPHRSHFYQRLVQTGLSHGAVTGLYGLAALVAAGAALGTAQSNVPLALGSAIALAPLLALVLLTVFRERRARRLAAYGGRS